MYMHQGGYSVCGANVFVGVVAVLSVWQWLSVAVKRHWERHGDVGWLQGGFAESRGNFPRRQLNSVVCQPPLALLAAIVPTAVNHAAYESEPQSIALLMNPNSSQSLSVGTHWHIWWFQLVTWIPSDRTSWRQAEINRNKYLTVKRWLCGTKIFPKTSPSWKLRMEKSQICNHRIRIWTSLK